MVYGNAAYAICIIPQDLEQPISDKSRFECLKNAYFLQEPKRNVSLNDVVFGPQLEDDVVFKPDEQVYCRYFYRYQNGSSNKFRCYRTNEKNILMNDKGEIVFQAQSVGAYNTEQEDYLLDQNGQIIYSHKNKPMKADVLKVRFQDGSKRHRENYASTVASRISWILGFPMEHYYSVKNVHCFGCEKNPWNEGLKPQLQYNPKVENSFPFASIERKNEAKRVIKAFVPQSKKYVITPWNWNEFVKYSHQLNAKQNLEFQVLALYANLMQTVENRGSQHVVLCEKKYYNKENKTCEQTLAGTHDMGAAFGNRALVDKETKNHPRADYKAYQATVMLKPNTCELGTVPGGLIKVSEDARREFVNRLEILNPSMIKEILRSAYFQYADLGFYNEIKKNEKLQEPALSERVLHLWSELIYSKMQVFKNTKCL